jgi:hypothetical protein
MRRVFLILAIILTLALPVSALGGNAIAQSNTTVSSDGRCDVTLNLQLTLDSISPALVFPVPGQASNITLNGTRTNAAHSGSVRNVDLTDIITAPGTYNLTICYQLKDVITADKEENLFLSLELLSGFEYPIDTLSFRITLPDSTESRPSFNSTYYQDTIETMMDVRYDGNVIIGNIQTRLQDHEKLIMLLPVSQEMFPQPVAKRWSMDTVDLVMIGIAAAAIAYWLIFLRCLPPQKIRRTTLSDGITAGEIGIRLTGQGADLTLMVLSWAQMGYLLIQPDDNGRVLLHKRMDMGNERGDFEIKWFRKLFGKRSIIDGTGYFYAQLCRKAAKCRPGIQGQFLRSSGNPTVFRVMAAIIGAVSGVSLAAAFAPDSLWQTVLAILLGSCGFGIAWLIQSACKALHSRHRYHLWLGLTAAVLWFLLSYAAGEWNVALFQIPAQLLAGLAALYGGRRSESGEMNISEILGLRQYLKSLPPEELKRNLKINPQYFYDLAPYALALGVDRAFARQLKKVRLPECPYLTTGMDGHMTAPEWNQLLRDTVTALDAMQLRLPIDRLLGR